VYTGAVALAPFVVSLLCMCAVLSPVVDFTVSYVLGLGGCYGSSISTPHHVLTGTKLWLCAALLCRNVSNTLLTPLASQPHV
jgi:hypothetical protein